MSDLLSKILKASNTILNSLPCAFWCKNEKLEYISNNDKFTNLIAINEKMLLNNNDYNMPWEKYAEEYRKADKQVLQGKSLAILHPVVLGNQSEIMIVSRKSPMKDNNNTIIGVIGLVTVVSCEKVSKSFKTLSRVDEELSCKSSHYFLNSHYENYKLTRKEYECLFLLIRGKTVKEIAKLFGLSHRTIETHVENIKNKLNCRTKSELLNKVIEDGLFNIIPNSINFDSLDGILKG